MSFLVSQPADEKVCSKAPRALVIGQGSIGQRHARLLRNAGRKVNIVSERAPDAFRSVPDAFANSQLYDEAVVANTTSRHLEAIQSLFGCGFGGSLLIEKPVAASLPESRELARLCSAARRAYVGYNLRFHPVVAALRTALSDTAVLEARLSVGQFLPDWRPGTDYRTGSSALLASGGGALRDLSHEIDLLLHLFGPWERLVSLGGNLQRLDIETDEAWFVVFKMRSGALISLTLNYFDRPAQRSLTVTTRESTLRADLINCQFSTNGSIQSFSVERDTTYEALHHALTEGDDLLCTLDQAIDVMRTIDAIERSNLTSAWVYP